MAIFPRLIKRNFMMFPFLCLGLGKIPAPVVGLVASSIMQKTLLKLIVNLILLKEEEYFVNSLPIMSTKETSKLPFVDKLAIHANSFAAAHGVQIEKKREADDGRSSSYFECAPVSLLPNAYPKESFTRARSLAPSFNLLVDKVSRDYDFLQSTLGGSVSEFDPYTGKLLQLYKQIYVDDDQTQPNFAHTADRLGIHRSDYMLSSSASSPSYQIKQVELNTIASSFAGLAVNVAKLHRHLISRFQKDVKDFLQSNKALVVGSSGTSDKDAPDDGVPVNPALTNIPLAMNVAHVRYVSRFCSDSDKGPGPVILFVVQEGETNTVDQRLLEFQLWENHNIPVVRMSLTKAHTELSLDDTNGALMITSTKQQISVVYYRAGYAPTDYPDGYENGKEWLAREKIERSRATKSPSLGYHLSGTKKVQQELAREGILERFFTNTDDKAMIQLMRQAFAGLYSLSSEDITDKDKEAIKDILFNKSEGNYVLKPQREGGGYNYYNEKLEQKLRDNVQIKDDKEIKLNKELGEFILMERLFPPQQAAILLRSGKVEGMGDTISELGCFGTLVVSPDGNDIIHNEYAGFLLRTKFSNVDEGGVASGFATLSSPYLC